MSYANGYSNQDPTIKYFWETFHEFPEETKRKFLGKWVWPQLTNGFICIIPCTWARGEAVGSVVIVIVSVDTNVVKFGDLGT